jgi:hypothetical protein
MIVRVTGTEESPAVGLTEPDEFTRLHVEAPADLSAGALGSVLAAGQAGELSEDGESVLLSVEWLRSGTDDTAGFDAMIAYAATKGWLPRPDVVQAHIVRYTP